MTPQTLIFLVGTPASGKSTIAKSLAETTAWKHIDIGDDVRTPYFGEPPANDGTDPEVDRKDRLEMAGSYDILFGLAEGFLHARRSLIVTCTLSSEKWGQRRLEALCAKYPQVRLCVIWCKPQLSDEKLQERIDARLASGYTGGTRSATRVRELEKRYKPIVLPHLCLDTFRFDVETCLSFITTYIGT